jgi:hypothetical protein
MSNKPLNSSTTTEGRFVVKRTQDANGKVSYLIVSEGNTKMDDVMVFELLSILGRKEEGYHNG